MMIEQIRREHGYMVRLLAILRKKLNKIKEEQPINYSLVKEIVDYLSSHSESTHHPKEDILYQYYMEHYGAAHTVENQEMKNLELEHKVLSEKTHEFMGIVDMILQDAVVPLDVFSEQLESFILEQKRHLDFEEREILPLISETFTTEDWQAVESQWDKSDDDPVFGDTIADKYKQLAERVRQTEDETL
ncbi:hemerythrin domain-containing protein [Vibrio sp. JC009]|uniref:hemerythrin domain-containing protein n=1 Tax=Vibrio sp. JC009 TaxID=2912314 RepID=UPI0023AF4305|nr:hemerythrin domain-containing protein [Vibrio sp. JC009]WED22345.1 hemerythrin domain-containing protein [Vibrio sp. JC009]